MRMYTGFNPLHEFRADKSDSINEQTVLHIPVLIFQCLLRSALALSWMIDATNFSPNASPTFRLCMVAWNLILDLRRSL